MADLRAGDPTKPHDALAGARQEDPAGLGGREEASEGVALATSRIAAEVQRSIALAIVARRRLRGLVRLTWRGPGKSRPKNDKRHPQRRLFVGKYNGPLHSLRGKGGSGLESTGGPSKTFESPCLYTVPLPNK